MSDDAPTRMLEAAGRVFAEKGYQAATVREICQEAGVNIAAIHYHFGDKESLYVAAVKLAHLAGGDPAPALALDANETPREQLRHFILATVSRMMGEHPKPWQAQLLMREMLNPSAACRAALEAKIRPHFHMLLSILDRLLPAGTPDHVRRQIGFSVIGQCLHYRLASAILPMLVPADELKTDYTPSRLADHIWRFSLSAIDGWR